MKTREEVEAGLKKEYPVLFQLLNERMNVPAERRFGITFGLEIGEGWFSIIETAAKELNDLNQGLIVHQIKEKFGTLRIYLERGTPEAHEVIQRAEILAETTCEVCAAPEGRLRTSGWWCTVCDSCQEERTKDRMKLDGE